MRNFGFLIVLVSLTLVLTASAGTSKEHKKKLLEKLRAALNTNETESIIDSMKDVEAPPTPNLDKTESVTEVKPEGESSKVDLPAAEEVKPETTPTGIVAAATNQYMTNLRVVMKRIMEILGLRREKKQRDARNNRMLEVDTEPNAIERVPLYREEVRATVGAVLGDKECIQQVACVAGSNMRSIKGKQIIFALLENFSPKKWRDTVRVAKQAAILESDCNFKCLEG